MNASWIATRTLLAVRPDGQELAITFRIGVPYEIAPEEWLALSRSKACGSGFMT